MLNLVCFFRIKHYFGDLYNPLQYRWSRSNSVVYHGLYQHQQALACCVLVVLVSSTRQFAMYYIQYQVCTTFPTTSLMTQPYVTVLVDTQIVDSDLAYCGHCEGHSTVTCHDLTVIFARRLQDNLVCFILFAIEDKPITSLLTTYTLC